MNRMLLDVFIATFTRDGDALIRNDTEKDAGNGLRFVRAAEEEEEEG